MMRWLLYSPPPFYAPVWVLIVLALLLVLVWGHADAYTCVDSSCTLDLEFTEPSTDTKGQPLKDLKETVWTYQRVGGPVQILVIPASNPKGGGKITTKTAPQTIPPGTSATFTGSLVWRTASGANSVAVPMSVTVVR